MALSREERPNHRDEVGRSRLREPLAHELLRGLGLLPEAVALAGEIAGDRLEAVDHLDRFENPRSLIVLLPRLELRVERSGDEQRLVGRQRGIVYGHARRIVDEHDHAAEPGERFGEDDVGTEGEHGHGREQQEPQGRKPDRTRSPHIGKLPPQEPRRHEQHHRHERSEPPRRDVARESQAQVCGTDRIHAWRNRQNKPSDKPAGEGRLTDKRAQERRERPGLPVAAEPFRFEGPVEFLPGADRGEVDGLRDLRGAGR